MAGTLQVALSTSASHHWLPVALETDEVAGAVRWMDFGGHRLEEPFFDQTVAKLRLLHPPAEEAVTDLQVLLDQKRELGSATPAGLIFHISRCGSTIISNALKTCAGAVVLSEPQTINSCISTSQPEPEGWNDNTDDACKQLLESLASVHSHDPKGNTCKLVIKFTSWNILWMPLILSVWQVPCLIVIRDPVEVITAHLASPSGWMARRVPWMKQIPGSCWTDEQIASMTREEYCARSLSSFMTSAASSMRDTCRIIDYTQITPERLRDVAEWFGLVAPSMSTLERVLQIYSKDRHHRYQFRRDREQVQRRRFITEAARSFANEFAYPHYADLRALSHW